MAEFGADVELRDIAVRDTDVSAAVDEPFRAMILDMLAEREMSVGDVHAELAERGFVRTENTVRHHVNELRTAGLVEVARLEERRGGTTKYYRANTIVLSDALQPLNGPRADGVQLRTGRSSRSISGHPGRRPGGSGTVVAAATYVEDHGFTPFDAFHLVDSDGDTILSSDESSDGFAPLFDLKTAGEEWLRNH